MLYSNDYYIDPFHTLLWRVFILAAETHFSFSDSWCPPESSVTNEMKASLLLHLEKHLMRLFLRSPLRLVGNIKSAINTADMKVGQNYRKSKVTLRETKQTRYDGF